ncbi:MAG: hypothetical protein WBW93_09155 [Steroidobacteraceae bacterium]
MLEIDSEVVSFRAASDSFVAVRRLRRRDHLTLPMIRALYEKLDIPPALLVRGPSGKYEIGADFDEALRGSPPSK